MAIDHDDADVGSDKLRRRTIPVKVYLAAALYDQLDDIAQRRGFPVSSLMALVAGEYVEKVSFDLQTRRIVALEIARRGAAGVSDPASERRPL